MLIIASPAENWLMATGEFCYLKVDDTQVYELQFVCLGVKKVWDLSNAEFYF